MVERCTAGRISSVPKVRRFAAGESTLTRRAIEQRTAAGQGIFHEKVVFVRLSDESGCDRIRQNDLPDD
jgi:hypothetical protein